MMDMMDTMGLWALVVLVILIAGVALAAYAGVRASRGRQLPTAEDAQQILQRRLASGDITPEEFYERDSALRSGTGRG